MLKVLITCPPMLKNIELFRPLFKKHDVEIFTPNITQTMTVEELKKVVPDYDGWIIGDDPVTREVFKAGREGRLKAAVKWGVGVDNIDFKAAEELNIPITNTPNMFGNEVADVALSYVLALARETFEIDRKVRNGQWIKPTGISLAGKTVALLGFGDIGTNVAKRLQACNMKINVYDPYYNFKEDIIPDGILVWPEKIEFADFIVLTCSLTKENYHIINNKILSKVKKGIRIVNVARGPLIDEKALVKALENETVHSVALDVFEIEPLPIDSGLRKFEKCIFGTHNSSNTIDAVIRTSELATNILFKYLRIK